MNKVTERILRALINCIENADAIIFVGIGIVTLSLPAQLFIGYELLTIIVILIGLAISIFGWICFSIGVRQGKF